MMEQRRDVFTIVGLATCLKILLMRTYHSTDFEVHRNWLAITHSLPTREWYHASHSQWTLDYPPFFAWFEWLLSNVAGLIDPAMLKLENLNYDSDSCVLVQRSTVIISDLVLCYAAVVWDRLLQAHTSSITHLFQPLVIVGLVLNPGLFIVDHIHFQYNGILIGIMLLAMARVYEGSMLWGAFWFSVLLNMKHIFLYIAPAFFVYMLSAYVLERPRTWTRCMTRLSQLAVIVLGVFAVSFGPFIGEGQFSQVLSRLFPVKRGLIHAYWAPNIWALYAGADKVLEVVLTRIGVREVARSSLTAGRVEEAKFAVLPDVPVVFTICAALVLMLPSLYRLFRRPSPTGFIQSVVHCGLVSFLVGFHVHEKAIIIPLLSLLPLAVISRQLAGVYVVLSTVAHFSLFPLIITNEETLIKVALVTLYGIYITYALSTAHRCQHLSRWGRLYLSGFAPLVAYTEVLWKMITPNLPFLPLMAISLYCAMGINACFLRMLFVSVDDTHDFRHLKTPQSDYSCSKSVAGFNGPTHSANKASPVKQKLIEDS